MQETMELICLQNIFQAPTVYKDGAVWATRQNIMTQAMFHSFWDEFRRNHPRVIELLGPMPSHIPIPPVPSEEINDHTKDILRHLLLKYIEAIQGRESYECHEHHMVWINHLSQSVVWLTIIHLAATQCPAYPEVKALLVDRSWYGYKVAVQTYQNVLHHETTQAYEVKEGVLHDLRQKETYGEYCEHCDYAFLVCRQVIDIRTSLNEDQIQVLENYRQTRHKITT